MARRVDATVEGIRSHRPLTAYRQHGNVVVARRQKPHAKQIGQDMADRPGPASEPSWLDPANDRKSPYTDAELDMLAADFIAMNGDTPVW